MKTLPGYAVTTQPPPRQITHNRYACLSSGQQNFLMLRSVRGCQVEKILVVAVLGRLKVWR